MGTTYLLPGVRYDKPSFANVARINALTITMVSRPLFYGRSGSEEEARHFCWDKYDTPLSPGTYFPSFAMAGSSVDTYLFSWDVNDSHRNKKSNEYHSGAASNYADRFSQLPTDPGTGDSTYYHLISNDVAIDGKAYLKTMQKFGRWILFLGDESWQ